MCIGEIMLRFPLLYEKGFLLCSCLILEFIRAWHAIKLVLLSSVMMSRSKVVLQHSAFLFSLALIFNILGLNLSYGECL